jgi:hypothetical protein
MSDYRSIDEDTDMIKNMLFVYGLTSVLKMVTECAEKLEQDIKKDYDTKLLNALGSALCDISFLTDKKRPKNFMNWVANHSRQTHFDVYNEKVSDEFFPPALKELKERFSSNKKGKASDE